MVNDAAKVAHFLLCLVHRHSFNLLIPHHVFSLTAELIRLQVLRRMSPEEIKWLVRIMLKGLLSSVLHRRPT